MLGFTFELFIEISFRYLSLSYGVFCKVGVFASLSERSERLESNEKNENEIEKNTKWKMRKKETGRSGSRSFFFCESQMGCYLKWKSSSLMTETC